jgi:hypothetical protein
LIRGEHKEEKEVKEKDYLYQEMSYGLERQVEISTCLSVSKKK